MSGAQASADRLAACTQCGACRAGCPTFDATLDEGRSGRGRVVLARGILGAVLDDPPAAAGYLTSCTRCGWCEKTCPVGVPVVAGIAEARARVAPPGWRRRLLFRILMPRRRLFDLFMGALALWQRLLGRSRRGRIEGLPGLGTRKGLPRLLWRSALRRSAGARSPGASRSGRSRLSLFVGCRIDRLFPGIALQAAELLQGSGFEVALPRGQTCSGTIVEGAGDPEAAARLRAQNARALDCDAGPPVATLCASCRRGVGGGAAVDAAELVAERLLSAETPAAPGGCFTIPEAVALHVPCSDRHFGRAPRHLEALLRARGYEVHLVGGQACCGGAIPFAADHPEEARALGRALLESEVRARGCRTLVTSDPGCLLHFRELAQEAGDLRVLHAIEALELRRGG